MAFAEFTAAAREVLTRTSAERAPSRADSRSQAVLVQFAKKVPAQTFEVAVRSLNTLAARALENLPRAGGMPVIRAIGKEDALGFTFLFKIAPEELAPARSPASQPLAPRSPFRKSAAEDAG